MEVHKTISLTKLQTLLDAVRGEVGEWKIVDVALEDGNAPGIEQAAAQAAELFRDHQGSLFICGARRILVLVRLGGGANLGKVREDVVRALPEYACNVSTGAVTKEGLETIKISLRGLTESAPDALSLLKRKKQRGERVFFVVDDDLFMRSLLVKALKPHGKVLEFADGPTLAEDYLRELPDVVFLDIHLPCGSGMDLMNKLFQKDSTAGIVILSADSVKDNVLLAQARGARAFLAKPFTKDKIEEAMRKCLDQAELLLRQA
jgi:two-component system chemotaxis response regulator CheY